MSAKGRKSLCDLEGHDFISTTAPNFRKCRRWGCNGAECLKDGVWVLVNDKAMKKPSRASTTQSVLFHVEASQTGKLVAVEEDWLTGWERVEEEKVPKTFEEVQREIVERMERYIQDREGQGA